MLRFGLGGGVGGGGEVYDVEKFGRTSGEKPRLRPC